MQNQTGAPQLECTLNNTLNNALIVKLLQQRLPALLAVYLFGSQARGDANAGSDVDLAVLVAGYADPIELWDLSSDLAEVCGCEVDLLDLRAASTVMQSQILQQGSRLFALDSSVGSYEATLLSEMTALNEARAGILADIQQDGTVYGR